MTNIPREENKKQLYYMEQCAGVIRERENALGRPLKACVTTFGCQMNERDGEEGADLVLYNTCTVGKTPI